MYTEPLFKGLVIDEYDNPVGTALVGSEPCYVINDAGFLKHIPAKPIDMQVLETLGNQIEGNEHLIADQASKLLGQDDLFTHAYLENQLKNVDKQFEQILNIGIPEETRVYMGLMGFKVVLDLHGEVLKIDQPSAPPDEPGGED